MALPSTGSARNVRRVWANRGGSTKHVPACPAQYGRCNHQATAPAPIPSNETGLDQSPGPDNNMRQVVGVLQGCHVCPYRRSDA